MPKVRCAICKYEDWPDKMYYCRKCEMWFCSRCVYKSGLFGTGDWLCPKCHTKVS